MKHLKRFIVLAMVLGIGGILLMRVPATQFRGQDSQELTRHYNLIKAKDINSRTISLYSDDRKVETSGNDQIWMSDDMTLMIPEKPGWMNWRKDAVSAHRSTLTLE